MKILLIALLTLFSFSKVFAAGISVGVVSNTYDYTSPANAVLDDQSMGFNLGFTVHLDPTWSLDLGYTDYGTASRNFGFITTEVDTTSFSAALRGSMTVGAIAAHDIIVHGLVGTIMADMDISAGANTLSDSDTGLLYGFGASLMISALDEVSIMYKKADLDFSNTVNFQYDPETLELSYTRRF